MKRLIHFRRSSLAFKILVCLFLLFGLQLARADDGTANSTPQPDYQATRDWILSKVNQFGGINHYSNLASKTYTYSDMTITNGMMCFTETEYSTGSKGQLGGEATSRMVTNTYAINLTKVIMFNDYKTGFDRWQIFLTTETKAINLQSHTQDNDGWSHSFSGNVDTVDLEFCQPDSDYQDFAVRMKKALENLVRICKENAPPSNEPF